MESQNNLNIDNQDNFDFEFSSEPNPLQSRNNLNFRRKPTSKRSMERVIVGLSTFYEYLNF